MSSKSYVTDRKLKAIQVEIKTNETMQLLVQQIQSGWPEKTTLCFQCHFVPIMHIETNLRLKTT